MTCQQYQNKIEPFLDRELDAEQAIILQQHIESCVDCQKEYQYGRLLRSALATMPAEVSREGFFQTAFERVRLQYPDTKQAQHNKPHWRNRWIQMGFAGAVMASFMLWVVFSIFLLPQQNQAPIVQLALNQSLTIPIAFNASDNFDKVTITMQIPQQVELNGHKGKRTISWDTYLTKGNNVLKLPLTAVTEGDGLFMASLKHGNKVKTFKFHLIITPKDLSNKQSQFELLPA